MYFKYFCCSLRLFTVLILTSSFIGDTSFASSPAPSKKDDGGFSSSSAGESADQIYVRMSEEEKEIIKTLQLRLRMEKEDEETRTRSEPLGSLVEGIHYSLSIIMDGSLNIEFAKNAEDGQKSVLEWILANNLKPDQNAINGAFCGATKNNHPTILELMFANNLKPDPNCVDFVLAIAAKDGRKNIFELMLANNLKPTQLGINMSFAAAADGGHQEILEWMLANNLRPNQDGINFAFGAAAESGHQNILEWMLANNLRPDQNGIDFAFYKAAKGGHQNIMEWMLANNLRPDQNGIDNAFTSAAQREHQNILEWLLANNFRPVNNTIIQAYRDAVADERSQIAQFLEQRFPDVITPAIRNEQGRGNANGTGQANFARADNNAGRAFEIHRFATALNNDVCRIIRQKLDQAGRQPDNYLSFGEVVTKIRASAAKQNINLTGAFEGYIAYSSDEYKNTMSLAATFVLTFYPGAFDAWVQGFVVDSAQAYQCSTSSRSAPTDSCTAGFWERVITCLDRLVSYGMAEKDPELFKLLGGAQDKMFLQQKIGSLINLEFLVKALSESGFPKDCSMDQLKEKVNSILKSKFDAGDELQQARGTLEEYAKHEFWETLYKGYTGKEYTNDSSSSAK